jgi:hypothetical protein
VLEVGRDFRGAVCSCISAVPDPNKSAALQKFQSLSRETYAETPRLSKEKRKELLLCCHA